MKTRINLIALMLVVVLAAPSWAFQASGGGSGGSSSPSSTFSAGANLTSIIPGKNGNIWYVDGVNGSDSNTGKTIAQAFATIGKCVSSAVGGDVCEIFSKGTECANDPTHSYVENVVVNKPLALIPAGGPELWSSSNGGGVCIQAVDTTHAAVWFATGSDGSLLTGMTLVGLTGATSPIVKIVGDGSHYVQGVKLIGNNIFFQGNGITGNAPELLLDGGQVTVVLNTAFSSGSNAIRFQSTGGFDSCCGYFKDNIYYLNSGADYLVLDTGSTGFVSSSSAFVLNHHEDLNKAVYADFSAAPEASSVDLESFNTTALTAANFKTNAASVFWPHNSSPIGEQGSNAGIQPKSVVSSTITTGGVLGFTASGALQCSDVLLETNSTGLAAGTNLQVVSNAPSGLSVICAEAVANLGASKTVKCSSASVTPLAPFTLADTNTLTLKCTVANCTGAGTIKLTPICVRSSQYATLN